MSSISTPELQIVRSKILTIRGIRVMLDRDLAALYQVETRRLNEQVRRNLKRFPEDFMFQLTKLESEELSRSHIAILKRGENIKYQPFAFTEQGVSMLSSVLKSDIAIAINIKIVRAFVELRQLISGNNTYLLLQKQLRRIEAEQETPQVEQSAIRLNQQIDTKLLSDKVLHLSKQVSKMSEILDEFQDSHLIIKRP